VRDFLIVMGVLCGVTLGYLFMTAVAQRWIERKYWPQATDGDDAMAAGWFWPIMLPYLFFMHHTRNLFVDKPKPFPEADGYRKVK